MSATFAGMNRKGLGLAFIYLFGITARAPIRAQNQ